MSLPIKLQMMFRSFRSTSYRVYCVGQMFSQNANWIQTVSLWWLIYNITHSSTLLGIVAFLTTGAGLFISPVSGIIIDKYDKRKLFIITQLCPIFISGILMLLGFMDLLNVWFIITLSLINGVLAGIDSPLRNALMSDIVPAENVLNALSLNVSILHFTRATGPAVAAIFISIFGPTICFMIVFIFSLINFYLIRKIVFNPSSSVVSASKNSILRQIIDGFRYATKDPVIAFVLIQGATFSFLSMPYAVIMPVFAADILNLGSGGLGLLMSASGIGAFIGAILLSARSSTHNLDKVMVYAMLIAGSSTFMLSISKFPGISLIMVFLEGVSMICVFLPCIILLQANATGEYRGRIMALYFLCSTGFTSLNALSSGLIIKWIGPQETLLIKSILVLATAFIFYAKLYKKAKTT